jgi:hypothetical protein
MPTFVEHQGTNLATGFLRGDAGRAFLEAFGAMKDAQVARAKEAVKARMPGVCPADALAILGGERGIDRGLTESEESFRSRVRSAWDVWRWAGTPYGLLLAFYWAGYRPTSGKVVLQTQGGKQHELRADFDPAVHTPENAIVVTNLGVVHLGGTPAELWSDCAVIFLPPVVPAWLPTPPADGSAEVEAIRRLISKWKPAHARCVRLRVSTVDLWDYPAETWEPTTEVWDETGVTSDWTPPAG